MFILNRYGNMMIKWWSINSLGTHFQDSSSDAKPLRTPRGCLPQLALQRRHEVSQSLERAPVIRSRCTDRKVGAQWRLFGWIPRVVRDPHPGCTMGPSWGISELSSCFLGGIFKLILREKSYGNDDIKVTKFGEVCSRPSWINKRGYCLGDEPTRMRSFANHLWLICLLQIMMFQSKLLVYWMILAQVIHRTSSIQPSIPPREPF